MPKNTSRQTVMSISTPPMTKLLRSISSTTSMRIAPMAAAMKLSTPPITAIATTRLIWSRNRLFGVTMPT